MNQLFLVHATLSLQGTGIPLAASKDTLLYCKDNRKNVHFDHAVRTKCQELQTCTFLHDVFSSVSGV